jgi:hypothetical protein
MFELDFNVNVYANGGGFGCAIFEPSSWTPSNGTELPYPAQVTIGGPGGNGSSGIVRTPFCLYTGEGDSSATQVVPATGTAIDPPPAGLGDVRLPDNFISNQTPLDTSDVEAQQTRQTFQVTHMSAAIEPEGYQTGNAVAVNVVSGEILGFMMTCGDNNDYNPCSPAQQAVGDSFNAMVEIPKDAGLVNIQVQSIAEWVKGEEMHIFCVPDTSICTVPWPAADLGLGYADPVDPTPPRDSVSTFWNVARMGFIIRGAQPYQSFNMRGKCVVAAFGTETYEVNAASKHRKPVDTAQLDDILGRAMPMHAQPYMRKIGAMNPAGAKAFAQHKADTGTSKSALPGVMKAAGKVAQTVFEADGIGEVLGDIGAVLAGILF